MTSTIGIQNLIMALQQALVPSSYQGTVGIGSTDTQVVDSVGGFATDQWADWGIQFTQDTATAALRGVWRQITSNTGTTHAVAALPAVPAAGDTYNIRPFGASIFDLNSVNGTAQTGADWTLLFQHLNIDLSALRDALTGAAPNNATLFTLAGYLDGVEGLLTSIQGYVDALETSIGATGDAAVADPALAASTIAALKGLLTDVGQTTDAVVAAGAAGSASAKLRRLTSDLGGILTAAGTTADAAVADPAAVASIIAALKGLLTDVGQNADAAVAAGAAGSVSAKLRRATTDLGTLTALTKTLTRASISIAVLGDNTVIAGQGVGTFIHIVYLMIANASDTDVVAILKDNATAINGGGFQLAKRTAGVADSGFEFRGAPGQAELVLANNAPFIINLSAAKQFNGWVEYYVA